MGKKLAILGLSAGLVGGGAAGLAFTGTTGIAGAQSETTTTVAEQPSSDANADRPDPSSRLQEALAPLVTDGTLTQDQADKVVEALKAAGPPDGGGHGRGGRGGPGLEAAATALGLSEDDLRTELQDGSTIAEIASEKGVDLATVTDAMLAAEKEKLAEAVSSGKLTQEQADERLSGAEERITARVNGEQPEGGPGRGGPGGPGGQPPADAPTDAPADSSTTTTQE